jgi:hypothetical protein
MTKKASAAGEGDARAQCEMTELPGIITGKHGCAALLSLAWIFKAGHAKKIKGKGAQLASPRKIVHVFATGWAGVLEKVSVALHHLGIALLCRSASFLRSHSGVAPWLATACRKNGFRCRKKAR